jgi:hypothetical protein
LAGPRIISLFVRVPEVAVVNQTIAANTLPEFVAYARANPGKINFGSAGAGSVTHLGVELLKTEAKIDLVHALPGLDRPKPTCSATTSIDDLGAPFIAPYVAPENQGIGGRRRTSCAA